jgi:hypothetical protein
MRLSYDVGRQNGNSKIIQKSRLLGLHYREGVTKSPLEASDELEICAADEQRANKLSSASVQRSGCFATNGATNLVRREGAQQAEDYFMKGRKQYV